MGHIFKIHWEKRLGQRTSVAANRASYDNFKTLLISLIVRSGAVGDNGTR